MSPGGCLLPQLSGEDQPWRFRKLLLSELGEQEKGKPTRKTKAFMRKTIVEESFRRGLRRIEDY